MPIWQGFGRWGSFGGGASGGSGDPYGGNVVLLFHFNEANGSTTFIDYSGHGHTLTIAGNPAASNVQAKFGSTSLRIQGTSTGGANKLVTDTSPTDFTLDGDFTIECWAYVSSKTDSNMSFLSRAGNDISNGGFQLGINSSNQWSITIHDGSFDGVGGATYTAATWTHIAVDRSGTTLWLYVNGTAQGSCSTSGTFIGGTFEVGLGATENDNGDWNGYLQDLRVTQDVARYAGSNFTPPTALYPNP